MPFKPSSIGAFFLVIGLFQGGASAQTLTGIDRIKANTAALAQQYGEVDAMLASTDKNKRIAAMVSMLKSGDPIYQKRAREVGLFSPDPEMRILALRALMDTGGPFRVDVYLKNADEEKTLIRNYLASVGGTWDEQTGFGNLAFRTGAYNDKEKCWMDINNRNCRAYLTGESIQFRISNAVLTAKLGTDGRMIGQIRNTSRSKYQPVPAAIDFIR